MYQKFKKAATGEKGMKFSELGMCAKKARIRKAPQNVVLGMNWVWVGRFDTLDGGK